MLNRFDRLDVNTSGMLPPLPYMRPSIPNLTTTSDREPYAHPSSLFSHTRLSPHTYTSLTEAPRNCYPTTALFSPTTGPYATHMASASSQNGQNTQGDCSNFKFPDFEVTCTLICEGQEVTPDVSAKVEKGFFVAPVDESWTCYRRNYFSVLVSFSLCPITNNSRIYFRRNGSSTTELIQAFGMRLTAAVDGASGKPIELIQHTPKRDAGPKTSIEIVPVAPTAVDSTRYQQTIPPHAVYSAPLPSFHPTGAVPCPYLPLQTVTQSGEASSSANPNPQLSGSYYPTAGSHMPLPGHNTTHTFERVQFKNATANNGKRRASQQYFHLIVEVFADIRNEGAAEPAWVKVAQRTSEKIVVRGRSPSHYQHEGQGQGSHGSVAGASGYTAAGGAAYGTVPSSSAFRSPSAGVYSGLVGSGGFRPSGYGLHEESGGSGSSPESVEGGAIDSDHEMESGMPDVDRVGIQDYNGYQYHPGAIYDSIPNRLPLPKVETDPRYSSTEPRNYAVRTEYPGATPGPQWQAGTYNRYQAFDSSRNVFADFSTSANNYS